MHRYTRVEGPARFATPDRIVLVMIFFFFGLAMLLIVPHIRFSAPPTRH